MNHLKKVLDDRIGIAAAAAAAQDVHTPHKHPVR